MEDYSEIISRMNLYTEDEIKEIAGKIPSMTHPGLYVMGEHANKIKDAINTWKKVIVVGKHASGKTVNSKKALEGLDHVMADDPKTIVNLAIMSPPAVIFIDDIDCIPGFKKILKYLEASRSRILMTSTSSINVKGFYKITVKPPIGEDVDMLMAVKEWKEMECSNLRELSTSNAWKVKPFIVKKRNDIDEVKDMLSGKKPGKVNYNVILQAARNVEKGYKRISKIENTTRSLEAAFNALMAGCKPAPFMRIETLDRALKIKYRRKMFDGV